MSLRRLTLGEITLARSIFEDTIEYYKVWIHSGSYLPFGMQNDNTAMTPNGEIYYEDNIYSADFSRYALRGDTNTIGGSHLFIHEMVHVWQYQKGYSVKLHGLLSWAADYTYYLDAGSLISYSMEQQASIISDYWLLKTYGLESEPSVVNYKGDISEKPSNLLLKYEHVLGLFPRCVI